MIDKPIDEYTLDMPPGTQLSDNFQLWETTDSGTASRAGINNRIQTLPELHSVIRTTRRIIQPVRNKFGPYKPNSVYRCQALERALPGRENKPADWMSSSQHPKGEAADMEVMGVSNIDLAKWIEANLEFDQLILECYNPADGPNSGWVHTSLKGDGNNRGEVTSYIYSPDLGKYHYVPGIVIDA